MVLGSRLRRMAKSLRPKVLKDGDGKQDREDVQKV